MNTEEVMKSEEAFELAIRKMRDIVYGRISTDENWSYCRDNWMCHESVGWLEEQVKKQNENNSRKMDGHNPRLLENKKNGANPTDNSENTTTSEKEIK